MKELVIISGKGGSGKTTVSTSFARLSSNTVIADCDVDAPNMHILIKPQETETHDFISGLLAEIDQSACTSCGLCFDHCRFGAINKTVNSKGNPHFEIDSLKCEGCKLCNWVCPSDAISLTIPKRGVWMESKTNCGRMFHALLDAGGENSGKLVSTVKNKARTYASKENAGLLLVDGPPGIGCPVVASVSGADLLLVVTEPTQSGKHDLERVIKLANSFHMKVAVCINKWDINPSLSDEIDRISDDMGAVKVGRIRYDELVPKMLSQGKIIVDYKSAVSADIKNIWRNVESILTSD